MIETPLLYLDQSSRNVICNTLGVYILLDNEYGFKHVISVNQTVTKVLLSSFIAILISHLFHRT
jgi:hypothetical protein